MQKHTSTFDKGDYYGIRSPDAVLRVYKKPLRFGLYKADNRTRIWQEDKPLRWSTGGMRQSLERGADEQFFGGGEQNGSFSHRDKTVYVANNTNWNEGVTTTPSPSTSPVPATASTATPSRPASTTSAPRSRPASRSGASTRTTSSVTRRR